MKATQHFKFQVLVFFLDTLFFFTFHNHSKHTFQRNLIKFARKPRRLTALQHIETKVENQPHPLASPQTSFGVRFVTWGRNECVTNEPQRTSAGEATAPLIIAFEQALLFGQAKRVSLARSRKTSFTYPNRRACSQATLINV